MWSDDLHHALHALVSGERSGYYEDFGRVADVAKALATGFVYDGVHSRFRGRRHGRSSAGLPGSAFVVSLQNHDQVGNRARGDRLSSLVGQELTRVAAALILLSPFVPLIFQGEEWGATTPFPYFTDHGEPELARAVSEGRKREFSQIGLTPGAIPDPQALSTFESAKLDFRERAAPEHAATLAWYRRLLELRSELPEPAASRLDGVSVSFDEARRWVLLERETMSVLASFASEPLSLPLFTSVPLLASSKPEAKMTSEGLWLPPDAAVVFRPTDSNRSSSGARTGRL
jgi:maltooligosyltrehalose trehalohydrolase